MAIELYNDGQHVCIMFSELVDDEASSAVQANQFLIVTGNEGALIDPAGNMTYNALVMAMNKYFPFKRLRYIFASHQDPDIVASLNKWLMATDCTLYISKLWERFVPHFCTLNRSEGRIIGIPDAGGVLIWGGARSSRCRRISCMPRATSSSTMCARRSCFPGTWEPRSSTTAP